MAGISNLPPELIIPIMHFCETPYNLSALIQTSPLFLGIFLSNRHQIMEPVINDLEDRFGGPVPRMCLLAAHLRHVHSKRPDASSTRNLERELQSALSTCFKIPEAGIKLDQTHNLSLLCSLSTLLTEAEWVMRGYVPRAWHVEAEESNIKWTASDIATLQQKFMLSRTIKQRIFHSIFCFESYCQMYFLQKEPLFERKEVRQPSHAEFGESRESFYFKSTNAFLAIIHYVCQPYWVLESDIASYIEFNSLSPGALQNSCALAKPDQAQLYLDRFNDRTGCEMTRFVHFMLSQGIGMFFKVKMMDPQDQFMFILESFYNFATSVEPVHVVHGLNCYCRGSLVKYSPRLLGYVEAISALRLSSWLPPGISFMREYHAEQVKSKKA